MEKLSKEQAIVIMGFTGITTIEFSHFHGDVEKRLERPVWTHEFASKEFSNVIKELYKDDFISIAYSDEDSE